MTPSNILVRPHRPEALPNVRRGGRVHTYIVWTASAILASQKRKVRHFYVNKNRTEEAAREAAIAQRQRWEALNFRRQEGLTDSGGKLATEPAESSSRL
jgi:hypothetical protein